MPINEAKESDEFEESKSSLMSGDESNFDGFITINGM